MSENIRMALIVVFFLGMGSLLWYFLSGDGVEMDAPPASAGVTSAPVQVEMRTAEIPDVDFDPIPDRDYSSSEVEDESETNGQMDDDTSVTRSSGIGKVTVKIDMQDGGDIPEDLVISLHEHSEGVEYGDSIDTLRATEVPSDEGEAVFDRLPLKPFSVLASSSTHTGNTTAYLSKRRTERTTTLQVFPGTTISGFVVNADGIGIPGASVYVGSSTSSGRDNKLSVMRARISETQADDTGAFSIETIQYRDPPLQYQLIASAEGYAKTTSELLEPGMTDALIVLQPARVIEGVVIHRDSGEPYPNIDVVVTGNPAINSADATTDENGAFMIATLGEGEYRVGIDDDELVVTSESDTLEITDTLPDELILIEVVEGGVVEGRIYNKSTGQGIPNATIHGYMADNRGSGQKTGTSDSNGNYRLAGLRDGAYQVSYQELENYPRQAGYENRRNVSTQTGKTTSGIDFALEQGILVSGIVVDAEGKPVSGVSINGNTRNGSQYDYASSTPDGRFTLAGFKAFSEVNISASKSGSAAPYTSVKIENENVSDVRIELLPESKISGYVVDRNGNRQPEAQLYARATSGPGRNYGSSIRTSDDQGNFELTGLTAGSFAIHLYRNGGSGNNVAETVEVAQGEHLENVEIVWDLEEGLVIAGRVLDREGKGIRYASLILQGPGHGNTQTNDEGEFRLSNVQEGVYTLRADSSRHMGTQLEGIQAGTEGLQIVLQPSASISGTVVSQMSGQPVQEFGIRVKNTRNFHDGNGYTSFHDEEGAFRFTNINGLNPVLSVRAEGYAETTMELPPVTPGAEMSNVRVVLEEGAELFGTVTSSSGDVVPGASIFIGQVPRQSYQRDSESRTSTDQNGEFTVSSLMAGELTVSSYAHGYAMASQTVYLNRGDNEVHFVLGEGGTVEGYVTTSGEPVESANISASGQVNGSYIRESTTTDAQGFYSIRGLPDGVFSLNINGGTTRRNKNARVEVSDGMVTEFNQNFELGSSALEGYIYVGENETTSGTVTLNIDTGNGQESKSQEVGNDGYYYFEGLTAGQVSLRAHNTLMGNNMSQQKMTTGTLGENESIQLDLVLFGGATLTCVVQNVPQGYQTMIMLLAGQQQIPTVLDQQTMMALQPNMVSQSVVNPDGTALMSMLDPGEYTLILLAFDPAQIQESFSIENVVGQVVTIGENEELEVSLSF